MRDDEAVAFIFLFGGAWFAAFFFSFITARWRYKGKIYEKIWEGGVAVLSFLAGGAAVGFVTIGLDTDPGVLSIVVLSLGVAVTIFPALAIGGRVKRRTDEKRRKEQSESEKQPVDTTPAWLKMQGADGDIKKEAVPRDQAALEKIAQELYLNDAYRGKYSNLYNEEKSKIFKEAVSQIKNEAFLADIVMDEDACRDYREIAQNEIHDADILYQITLRCGYGAEHAERYSTEQLAQLLMNIDFKHMPLLIKNLAEKKKTIVIKPDKEIIARLLQFLEHNDHSDHFKWVIRLLGSRCYAYRDIQKMLAIRVGSKPWYNEMDYLQYITDKSCLAEIAAHSCNEKTFAAAFKKLTDAEQKSMISGYRAEKDLHQWQTIKGKCKKCTQCMKEKHYGETKVVRLEQYSEDTVCSECGSVLHSHLLD